MFRDRAAKLAPLLTKGSLVEVTGIPSVEAWIKKGDNSPQASIKLTVSEVKLHGGGQKDAPVADKGRATSRNNMDDDLPF